MKSKEFLKEIYKGCNQGFVTLTSLPDIKTKWFKINESQTERWC